MFLLTIVCKIYLLPLYIPSQPLTTLSLRNTKEVTIYFDYAQ